MARLPTMKPKDYERLLKLLYRIGTLKRCRVHFDPDGIDALERVVKILKPPPQHIDGPPPNFGKLS